MKVEAHSTAKRSTAIESRCDELQITWGTGHQILITEDSAGLRVTLATTGNLAVVPTHRNGMSIQGQR